MARANKGRLVSKGRFYLFVGLAGLLCVYAAEVLGAFIGDPLSTAEVRVFFLLNATLGRNRVWDWTIFAGGSPLYFWLALGAVAAAMIAEGWAYRGRTYGRAFGFVLFAVFLTFLGQEAGDGISDYIHRTSPWKRYEERAKESSREAPFVDFDRRVGVPDEKITAAVCLLCALGVRLPWSATLTTVLLAYYLLCQLTLGTQWLGTQLASAFFGVFLAGGVLLISRGAVRWVERKSEEVFLIVFGKWLFEGRFAPEAAQAEPPGFPREQWRKVLRGKQARKERFWETVVRHDALAILGAASSPARLERRPPAAAGMAARPSRYVRFLSLPEGNTVVVKALRRTGGMLHYPSRVARYARSAKAGLYLERLGLPVPRVFWVQDGLTTFGLRNYFLFIEEFVDGRPLNAADPAETARAMRLLASLHAFANERWGTPVDHRLRRRSQYVLRRLRPFVLQNLSRVRRIAKIELAEEEGETVWALFEEAARGVLADASIAFRLIHGDVTVRNFLVARDDLRFIDFVTVRYDLAAAEIIKASIALTDGSPEACASAWRAYFAETGAPRWQEFRRSARLGLASYALREFSHGRAGPLPQKGSSPSAETVLAWIRAVLGTGDRVWGASPEETDWHALLEVLARPSRPQEAAAAD